MKTLEIRNTSGGMIWQIYFIKDNVEESMLKKTAHANGFMSVCVTDDDDFEETWPDWRESESWKARVIDEYSIIKEKLGKSFKEY